MGVTIILVNYNNLRDTVECVKSIYNSKYKMFDIVVVDNGSKDYEKVKSDEYLSKHATIISPNENLGFSGGNNFGIKYALTNYENDYILLLNNDTIVDGDFLGNMVTTYKKNCVDYLLLTCEIRYNSQKELIWYGGGAYNHWKGTATHLYNMEKIVENDIDRPTEFVTGCVLMMDKNTLKKMGVLSEKYFLYSEDTDFSLRAQSMGILMIYTPSALVYHKVSASTKKLSNIMSYYLYRNRLICIKYNEKGVKRLSALIFSFLVIIKAFLKRKMPLSVVKKIFWDFITGVEGKYCGDSL